MYLESSSNSYAVKRTSAQNPFSETTDIELSVLPAFSEKIKSDFNVLAQNYTHSEWDFNQIQELLQGTKVIQVSHGSKQSWQDILFPYLPDSIQEAEIYDRYLRNRCQLKSLEMFLTALSQNISSNGMKVEITATAEKDDTTVREQFKKLQNFYEAKSAV